jgi:hypothetical protein
MLDENSPSRFFECTLTVVTFHTGWSTTSPGSSRQPNEISFSRIMRPRSYASMLVWSSVQRGLVDHNSVEIGKGNSGAGYCPNQ